MLTTLLVIYGIGALLGALLYGYECGSIGETVELNPALGAAIFWFLVIPIWIGYKIGEKP
jgi:hypothetical protein